MDNGVTVSFGPPDLKPETSNPRKGRINLYLYKIVENTYLKNQEIPGHGHPSDYGHPPLSLVLFYLLTPFPDSEKYEDNYDLNAHEILGDAMSAFHDYPILTDSMEASPGSGTKLLPTSLRNQFEKIKITFEPLDTEELTKIWMGLNNPYRLSVGYAVSVIQIESKKPKKLAKPAKARYIHLAPLHRPQIDDFRVTPAEPVAGMPPATARIGDKLTLHGINFVGLSTHIIIGDIKFNAPPKSQRLIEFKIPDDPILQPGPTTVGVQVETSTEIVQGGYSDRSEVKEGKNVITSNQVPLMLVPKISDIDPTSGNHNKNLIIYGERLFNEKLKCFVLVGDIAIEVEKSEATDGENIKISLKFLKGAEKGEYLIRVRVNGGESLEDDKTFELT